MEILRLILKPFFWAFENIIDSEALSFDGVKFYYILLGIVVIGIIVGAILSIASGIGNDVGQAYIKERPTERKRVRGFGQDD